MRPGLSPEQTRPLTPEECFRFRCHPDVPCFTECCRQLDLSLTPYDVLRLAKATGVTPSQFLDQYAVIEQEEGELFPQVYLAMVDDGRASCPFVSPQGCGVYQNRPSACRSYPLGRGASLNPDKTLREHHILVSEPHCRGFDEQGLQNVSEWTSDQELTTYNAMNDLLLPLLHHPQLAAGMRPTPTQSNQYLFALYQTDLFYAALCNGSLAPMPLLSLEERLTLGSDNSTLLRAGIQWLHHVLFG